MEGYLMEYKSSFTTPIISAIIILFLFWLINFLVIIKSNGIGDVIAFSSLMVIFAVVFISFLVRGIYIVVENNNVKYVHMFFLRREVEIAKINKIKKSIMSGMYSSLSLLYQDNGKAKDIKISTFSFKNDTLKQFLSDLKTQNPKIEIDQSIS